MRRTASTLGAVLVLAATLSTSTLAVVAPSADEIDPVETGDEIPSVTVRTVEGETLDLSDAVGKQPTILIFYRGGW